MKSNPKTSGEYKAFSEALSRVLRISHSEMKTVLDEEKAVKTKDSRGPKSRRKPGTG